MLLAGKWNIELALLLSWSSSGQLHALQAKNHSWEVLAEILCALKSCIFESQYSIWHTFLFALCLGDLHCLFLHINHQCLYDPELQGVQLLWSFWNSVLFWEFAFPCIAQAHPTGKWYFSFLMFDKETRFLVSYRGRGVVLITSFCFWNVFLNVVSQKEM